MNEKVPFTRTRVAIFVTMCTAIAATGAANHLARGMREDNLVDLGLCVIATCTLLGLLLVFQGQRRMNTENTWRLTRVENRVMGCEAVAPFFVCDEGCECARPTRNPPRPRRSLAAVQDDEA